MNEKLQFYITLVHMNWDLWGPNMACLTCKIGRCQSIDTSHFDEFV